MTVEIDRDTPIKVDTVATLEMQGITGLAYVQLRGGTQASAPLDPDATPPPRIASRRSALEQVFESDARAPGERARAGRAAGRLLEDDNLAAVAGTLRNLETFTDHARRALRSGRRLLAGAGDAAQQVEAVASDLQLLVGDLRRLTAHVDERVGR